MTADNSTIANRFNDTVNKGKNKLDNLYNNDDLTQDYANWMGTWGNTNYEGDMHGIHKSKSKNFNQGGLLNDSITGFEDYNKNKLDNWSQNYFYSDWIGRNNLWDSNSDDEYVNNYLNTEYDSALEQLERALKRGTLTDTTYQNALDQLNSDRLAAETYLGDKTQSVIDGYISNLEKLGTNIQTDIDKYTLANYSQANSDFFGNQIDDLYNQQLNSLASNMEAAMDGFVPFDVSSIIGNAQVAGGINNNLSENLINVINDNKIKKDQQIGLGNQGIF